MKRQFKKLFSLLMLLAVLVGSFQGADTFGSSLGSTIVQNATIGITDVNDSSAFSWDNATVYFVLTDRFENGDTSNDHSYGREIDYYGNVYSNYKNEPATFHGGDLKGLTNKINEGYFTDLGVNAIWITAPYEQIHGWLGAEGFRHYAYHGYYALDFTQVDANMGTEQDLRTFIDTAHENGIRVIFDIVLNHAGYSTLKDMDEFGFGSLKSNWRDYYYSDASNAHWRTDYDYINKDDVSGWAKWWGPQWIRASQGYAGYSGSEGGSELTQCLAGLPDFKTETNYDPGLPKLLENKWKKEGRYDKEVQELNEFFNQSKLNRQVSNYLIKWLTDWVREYGVDGFRVDTGKHVDIGVWKTLKEQSVIALREWKSNNTDKKLDDLEFWMTGEIWGHGVSASSPYYQNGFDSVINFTFQGVPNNMNDLESTYSAYANIINNNDNINALSYISSHDTSIYNRNNLINGGTALLLAPGAVQIFYGDETARPLAYQDCPYADQKYRSDMNWNSINQEVLTHWQRLGQFRNNHIAVGAGQHKQISASPYTFSRTYDKNGINDGVIAVIGATGNTTIDVSSVFSNGNKLTNVYTGEEAVVANGKVTFASGKHGVILIEGSDGLPVLSANLDDTEFYTDSLEVTLTYDKADTATYSINGSEPVNFTSGTKISIGESATFGSEFVLSLVAENNAGSKEVTYTYIKEDPNQVLTVHYYKPELWGTPNIYYYDDSIIPIKVATAWPGVAMKAEEFGWYTYQIPLWKSAKVIFNCGSEQIPKAQEAGYEIKGEKWIKDGIVYNVNPDANNPPVNPPVKNEMKVYFYRPSDWGNSINIYYYDESVSSTKEEVEWPGLAMTSEGNDWYSYTIKDWEKASVMFNDGNNQIPGQGQQGYTVTDEVSYIKDGIITTTIPEIEQITVYFLKPSHWGTPNIYYYDDTVSPKKEAARWPGIAMKDEGNDWYSYTLSSEWEKAYVLFNSNGNQTPDQNQAGYLVTETIWIE